MKPDKNSQRGQTLIEAVLLMVVMVMVWYMIQSGLSEMRFVQTVVQGPWTNMQGLIESGVPAPAAQARAQHPGHLSRSVSKEN